MKNTAFNRGIRAANLWQSISKLGRSAHSGCIRWAVSRGLPRFAGQLPVPLTCIVIVSAAIACGIIFGTIVLLFTAFVYMLSNIALNGDEDDHHEDAAYGTEWRSGNEGTGIYTGPEHGPGPSYRIDTDDYDD